MSNPSSRHCLHHQAQGFSLVELLVVISLISLLAAILLPVFFLVQGKARQTVCSSNLQQVGTAMALYTQDNDGFYPYAIDPVDIYTVSRWSDYSDFQAVMPTLPQLQDVLLPYASSPSLFRCPADTGFYTSDFRTVEMDAFPSGFQKFGTSYGYRTELAARRINDSRIGNPAEINLLMDLVGQWHGTLFPLAQRYNVLFADGHVKNLNRQQADTVWANPIK